MIGLYVLGLIYVIFSSHKFVSDFISIFILKSQISPKPEDKIQDVDTNESLEKFKSHFISELAVLVGLQIDNNCEDLANNHQNRGKNPFNNDNFLHLSSDSFACKDINSESHRWNESIYDALDQQRYLKLRCPSETKEQ